MFNSTPKLSRDQIPMPVLSFEWGIPRDLCHDLLKLGFFSAKPYDVKLLEEDMNLLTQQTFDDEILVKLSK